MILWFCVLITEAHIPAFIFSQVYKNLYLLSLRLILGMCSLSFHQDPKQPLQMIGSQNPHCKLLLHGLWISGQQTIQDTSIFINDISDYPCLSFAQLVYLKSQNKLFTFFFPKAIDICLFVPQGVWTILLFVAQYATEVLSCQPECWTMGPFLKKTLWSIAHGMYSKKTKYDPVSDNAVESTNCHNQYQLSQYARASQHSQQLFWQS